MSPYDFAATFRTLYDAAVARYAQGQRTVATFFTADELAFLAAHGLTAQHLFDYAEDRNNYGEPGPDNALSIELVRRDYFLNVQGGLPSATALDPATLPAKTNAIGGIPWLPRLLPKARAKLRGELPSSMMYGCGGDRAFFKEHGIQPGEFLNLLWRHAVDSDDTAVIAWVVQRSATARK